MTAPFTTPLHPLDRRHLLLGGAALAAGTTLGASMLETAAATGPGGRGHGHGGHGHGGSDRRLLLRWARDTWASLVAMTDERTGLTADNIEGSVAKPIRSGYTSPTNIGEIGRAHV